MPRLHSHYDDHENIDKEVAAGRHRELIGGLWEEIGALQLNFLQANGLTSQSKLLDIGCGSLRLGVRAVAYLEAGTYWGTEINESLMIAGYEKEILPSGLADKLPRGNLVLDTEFTFAGVPRNFDFVIAQSVFTHLPLNHLRLCLANLAEHIEGPCKFFVTLFVIPEEKLSKPYKHHPGGITTYPHRDPYHYARSDLHHVISGLPWTVEYIGDWNHPRNQMMVRFTKEAHPIASSASLA